MTTIKPGETDCCVREGGAKAEGAPDAREIRVQLALINGSQKLGERVAVAPDPGCYCASSFHLETHFLITVLTKVGNSGMVQAHLGGKSSLSDETSEASLNFGFDRVAPLSTCRSRWE
jgi:hypothetical protein